MKKNNSREKSVGMAPLVWLSALEDANRPVNGAAMTLWNEIGMRAKHRGSESGGVKGWPGFVYLPAFLLERGISSRVIRVPPEWEGYDLDVLSRLVATLAAWNLDRHVYQFTDMAAKIVRNSSVQINLKSHPFAMLPGFAAYIDLANVRETSDSLPYGFFISVNTRENGVPELVLILDFKNRLDIRAIKLDGSIPDDIFKGMLQEWRASSSNLPLPADVLEFDANFHILLSSVLMTCINQAQMKITEVFVPDGSNLNQVVHIYEIGAKIVDDLFQQQNVNPARVDDEMIVMGEWRTVQGKKIIELKCAFSAPDGPGRYMSDAK